ncbi:MAG: PAS domain S-box protein [Chrysiogenales bacterium]|nr:MAG: PAS domain S-box protein [Chrysiogenales bacterium]
MSAEAGESPRGAPGPLAVKDQMDDNHRDREEAIEGEPRPRGKADRPPVPEREEGDEWRVMMEMLGDLLFIMDPSGAIVRANPAAAGKLGFSQDELLSMTIFDLYRPDRRSEAEEIYSQIIAGERYVCGIPFQARDGRLIAVETKIIPGRWRGEDVVFSLSRASSAGKALEYDLRLAFEKMKTVLDSVSAYIWSGIVDPAGGFSYIYQSPAVEAITGRRPAYFGQGLDAWFGIIHEDDRERVRERYRSLITGESSAMEDGYRIIHGCGDFRWVRDSVLAHGIGENRVRLDGVVTDISERRRAIEALEMSEGRLRGILSSMGDMVFAFDADSRFIFYHASDVKSLYVIPDQFIGRTHAEIMPPEINALFQPAFERIRQGGESEFEYWLDLAGGRRWFSTKLSAIVRDGNFDGAVAVVRDITTHKAMEETLVMSERRYRELFNTIHDGSTLVDMEGRIIDFNPPFQDLLGYGRDELIGMTVWEITPAEWHSLEREIIATQVIERGYSDVYRKEYRAKDGTVIPVEVQRCLLRDVGGSPDGMWVIVRSLKERSS